MDIHVYQSVLTGHWLVDLHGTKGSPSRQREGFKRKARSAGRGLAVGGRKTAHLQGRGGAMNDDSGESARQLAVREYLGLPTPVLVGDPDDDWRLGWE